MSTSTITLPDDLKARLTDALAALPEAAEIGGAMARAVGNGSVPQTTIGLVHLRVAQIFANTYQTVRATENLRGAGEPEARITAVSSWQDAPYFTDAERAALAVTEAVLTPNPQGERVSDELYAELAKHYDGRAIGTLIMAIGQVLFFVPLALIGKPLPGVSPAEQWRS